MSKYPAKWRITAILRAPEHATEEDVYEVLRLKVPALQVEKVELIDDHVRETPKSD